MRNTDSSNAKLQKSQKSHDMTILCVMYDYSSTVKGIRRRKNLTVAPLLYRTGIQLLSMGIEIGINE